MAGGVPDRPALLRPERRHLRALGLLRRRRRACGDEDAARDFEQGADTLAREPAPLGHGLLVALRPVPASGDERRQLLLPRAPHQPARGDAGDRSAARVRLRRAALRRLLEAPYEQRPRIRAQGAVPARGAAQRPARPADATACGAPSQTRPLSDTIVLCYHAVSERWPAALSVTPRAFEQQLELLVQRGYEGATFRDAVAGPTGARVRSSSRSTTRTCRCSSSRGRSLDRLGLPATVFVPTDFAGPRRADGTGPGSTSGWAASTSPSCGRMTWEQLAELRRRRLGDRLAHPLPPAPHELDDAALDEELRESRAECERRLGRPCTTLAYPYGDYDARVAEAADGPATRRRARCPREFTPRGRWSGRASASTTTTRAPLPAQGVPRRARRALVTRMGSAGAAARARLTGSL